MCMQSADEKMFEKYRDYLEGAIEFLKQVLNRYSAAYNGQLSHGTPLNVDDLNYLLDKLRAAKVKTPLDWVGHVTGQRSGAVDRQNFQMSQTKITVVGKLKFSEEEGLAFCGSTERNVQLLCETCNRSKGAII